MEIFYEKNLTNNSIDKHKIRPIVFKIIRILCVVIEIVAVFVLFYSTIVPSDENGGCSSGYILTTLLVYVGVLAPPVLIFIFIGRLNIRLNVEYDYHILGDILRVIKVINRKRRKKFLEFPLSAISALGLADSDAFNRHAGDKANKKQFVFCNEDAELLIYALANTGTGRQLIVLEADMDFLTALRKAIKSYSVMDDALKQYMQKATKAAEADEEAQKPAAPPVATETPAVKKAAATTRTAGAKKAGKSSPATTRKKQPKTDEGSESTEV